MLFCDTPGEAFVFNVFGGLVLGWFALLVGVVYVYLLLPGTDGSGFGLDVWSGVVVV
ncbi:hypothetical protein KIH77_01505 [Bifidobacterium sp. 82T24]|uniref:hypothetical protein n=1 Tax=Bifidobacterium pluvialisilvae TaxID=2834436 RepID=UPI001C563D94|nr:hypothetical protein [Bifidobacterium pluvialisilvae]MBW3087423.1 hypothetical protein [Bifidobacterium pluvialisilvae]